MDNKMKFNSRLYDNIKPFYVCDEMKRLRAYLNLSSIKWNDVSSKNHYWMCRTHFNYKGHRISVIHGFGSYGGFLYDDEDKGLLEMMIDSNEPEGHYSAHDIIEILRGLDEVL